MTRYPVHLALDDGTLLVTCPDLPEVTSLGADEAEALAIGARAVAEAVHGRLADGIDVPWLSEPTGDQPGEGAPIVHLDRTTTVRLLQHWAAQRGRVSGEGGNIGQDGRFPRSRPTALEAYARHGSCSYGLLAPERLRAILLGEPIVEPGDLARVEQALTEAPRARAHDLAAELGLTFEALDARTVQLLGRGLPD